MQCNLPIFSRERDAGVPRRAGPAEGSDPGGGVQRPGWPAWTSSAAVARKPADQRAHPGVPGVQQVQIHGVSADSGWEKPVIVKKKKNNNTDTVCRCPVNDVEMFYLIQYVFKTMMSCVRSSFTRLMGLITLWLMCKICFPKLRNTFTRKQQYYSSCCLGNLTNHFFFCIVTKCTTSKLSSVCFLRVRPTWSSLGQTVPGKWTESYRGRRLQVCVSPACCPTHCPNIYCTLWGYDQFWDGIILSSA